MKNDLVITEVIELSCASLSSIGSEACRILQKNPTGQVVAAFHRSFYVQSDHGIVCVGMASLGRGPLHVLLAAEWDELIDDPLGCVVPGQPVCFCDVAVINRERSYSGSVVDSNDSGFSEQSRHSVCSQRAISIIDQCELSASEGHGFRWLMDKTCWDDDAGLIELAWDELDVVVRGLRRQTFPALRCLYAWLESSFESATNDLPNQPLILPFEIVALSGAGPGLTPAGDDLLAGVMLALHRINHHNLADTLWEHLRPSLAARTNAISCAHLKMAAQGRCSESVLRLFDVTTSPVSNVSTNSIQFAAQAVHAMANGIGSSSGWDTLAGMSLVWRAMSRAKLFSPALEARPRIACAVDQSPLGRTALVH